MLSQTSLTVYPINYEVTLYNDSLTIKARHMKKSYLWEVEYHNNTLNCGTLTLTNMYDIFVAYKNKFDGVMIYFPREYDIFSPQKIIINDKYKLKLKFRYIESLPEESASKNIDTNSPDPECPLSFTALLFFLITTMTMLFVASTIRDYDVEKDEFVNRLTYMCQQIIYVCQKITDNRDQILIILGCSITTIYVIIPFALIQFKKYKTKYDQFVDAVYKIQNDTDNINKRVQTIDDELVKLKHELAKYSNSENKFDS